MRCPRLLRPMLRSPTAKGLPTVLGLAAVSAALAGCIIPLAPEFEPPEENLSPYIVTAEPPLGSVLNAEQEITVVLADPNLGDTLYARWVFNYPPWQNTSRWSIEEELPPALGGSPVRSRALRITPQCLRDLPRGSEHRVLLVVSDRPFLPADDSQTPIDQVPPNAFAVRANWLLLKECL